jgi:hypothetical protein
MLVFEARHGATEENEMHPEWTQQLAAQHIAELQQQAARQRVIRELRSGPGRANRRRAVWGRLRFRRSRPATA